MTQPISPTVERHLAACRRGTNNGPPANETMYIFAGRSAQKWVRTLWTVQKHAFSHPTCLSIRLGRLHFRYQACG